MRKLLLILLIFFHATFAFSEFRLVNHLDEVWRWDFDHGDVEWIAYQNLGAYAAAIHAPYNPARLREIERYNIEDVILYFISRQTSVRFQAIIQFSLLAVDVSWDWIAHPHAHEDSYAYSDYEDIVRLLEDANYIDSYRIFNLPNTVAFNTKLQEYINFARREWGLDEFPTGTEPPVWTNTIGAVKGGEWFRFTNDFWIARIDIAAASNTTAPNASAAYREQHRRHYSHEYDDNDLAVQLSFEAGNSQENDLAVPQSLGEVKVNFATDIVYLKPDSNLTIAAFNDVPRFSVLSIKAGGKWYIGNISHRFHHSATGIFEFRIDPQSEKGTFTDEESVIVQLEQAE